MRSRRSGAGLVVAALVLAGCAEHATRVRDPFALELFLEPLASSTKAVGGAAAFAAGWTALRAGDLGRAEVAFTDLAATRSAATDPTAQARARTGLGAVLLAAGSADKALAAFTGARGLDPSYAEAIAGQAGALVALGGDERAIDAIDGLEQASPGHPAAARLRSRLLPRARAKLLERVVEAERREDRAAALAALRRAVFLDPDDVALAKRLGGAALANGDTAVAEAAFATATARAPADVDAWLGLGEARMRSGAADGARLAFEKAARLPGGLERAQALAQRLRARDRVDLAASDVVARSLASAVLDRAGLAALLVARLPLLARRARGADPVIVTDVATSPAKAQIKEVVALGLVEVFDDHTFRPQGPVTRATLAHAAAAVLRLFRESGWIAEKPFDARVLTDVPPEHLYRRDVTDTLRWGVMGLGPEGDFRPAEAVSGEEAARTIDRLATLAKG